MLSLVKPPLLNNHIIKCQPLREPQESDLIELIIFRWAADTCVRKSYRVGISDAQALASQGYTCRFFISHFLLRTPQRSTAFQYYYTPGAKANSLHQLYLVVHRRSLIFHSSAVMPRVQAAAGLIRSAWSILSPQSANIPTSEGAINAAADILAPT